MFWIRPDGIPIDIADSLAGSHMLSIRILFICSILSICSFSPAQAESDLGKRFLDAKRIVCLGDSITFQGHYVTLLDCRLRMHAHGQSPEIINLGLPSETACGLTEPDHPFPRPSVHERLARILKQTKPDIVVACYGMNDGIYHPFSDERFTKYQVGIQQLLDNCRLAGATTVLLTPPPFDRLPGEKAGRLKAQNAQEFGWKYIYENYDEDVMAKYADWILTTNADYKIDIRSPIHAYVNAKRKTNDGFVMSGDGVHINDEGHSIIASAIIRALGIGESESIPNELVKTVREKQKLAKLHWLTVTGHKRPGVEAGVTKKEFLARCEDLERQISRRLSGKPAKNLP